MSLFEDDFTRDRAIEVQGSEHRSAVQLSDTPTSVGDGPATAVEPELPSSDVTVECPRCHEQVPEQEFYGPCRACVLELRIDARYHDFTPVPILYGQEASETLEDLGLGGVGGPPLPGQETLELPTDVEEVELPATPELTPAQLTAAATEAAIEQVDENADEEWKRVALEAVEACALEHPEFTADEVWVRLAQRPDVGTHEPAALGPVFLRAARAGWIENTGRRRKRSILQQRHRELTIWKSHRYPSISPVPQED